MRFDVQDYVIYKILLIYCVRHALQQRRSKRPPHETIGITRSLLFEPQWRSNNGVSVVKLQD